MGGDALAQTGLKRLKRLLVHRKRLEVKELAPHAVRAYAGVVEALAEFELEFFAWLASAQLSLAVGKAAVGPPLAVTPCLEVLANLCFVVCEVAGVAFAGTTLLAEAVSTRR